MDFPAEMPQPCPASEVLTAGLGRSPIELLRAFDYVAVFTDEAEVRSIEPDFTILSQIDLRGVIVTAPGSETDFVSRFFAPKLGVFEDPVTGSAHCELAPLWLSRLGKNPLAARQVSKRGGDLECEVAGDRVLIRGRAVTIMETEIFL
jgi:predicted PhzF superfamily epimerase YddE/YHI9